MPICVGVAFKRVSKSYWFDPNGLDLAEEQRVIVETSRGLEIGAVKIGARHVPEDEIQSTLKKVVRIATPEDYLQERENREKAKQALVICNERVKAYELTMRLLQAELSFDGGQITVYFSSENRVDFRELVRDIAGHLHLKVQLHQVGARDQAKMIGSIGPCGLTLCCASFLTDFAPVSMKMAKDQSLFLNPVKFSGVCGKLMCCLRYEHEMYTEAKPKLPQIGDVVRTPQGQGKVIDLNLATHVALVELFLNHEEVEFPALELSVEKTTKCTDCRGCSVDSLKEDADEAVTAK